jgi:hypothetical protein
MSMRADPAVEALVTARDLALAIHARVTAQISFTTAVPFTEQRRRAEALLKMQEVYLDRVEAELARRTEPRRRSAGGPPLGSAGRAERMGGLPTGAAP